MDDRKKTRRFTISTNRNRFTLRDLDNAQPVIPPPKTVLIDHPRLAPPGMSGIKRTPGMTADLAPRPPKPFAKDRPARAFKSLDRAKAQDWDIDR